MRVIEKDKLFEYIPKPKNDIESDYYCEIADTIVDLPEYIIDDESADVQPVIHAKWVLFDKDCVGRAFYCSNCRKVTTTDDFEDTPLDRDEYFCMRCGADMREPDATKG